MPTLILWGTSDHRIPVDLGRRLVKDLPNATLVELDAGHVVNQEKPEEVLRSLETLRRGQNPLRYLEVLA